MSGTTSGSGGNNPSETANLETGAGESAIAGPATGEASVAAMASPQELVAELESIRARVLPILQATKDRYEGRVRGGFPTIIDNVNRGGIFGLTLDSGFGIYFQTDGQHLFAELHLTHLRTDTLSAANAEKFAGRPEIDRIDIDGSWDVHRYRDLVSRLLMRWNSQQTRTYRTDS